MWLYDKANPVKIQEALKLFRWEHHFSLKSPDAQVNCLNETILNVMRNFVPSIYISSSQDKPKWITKDIKNLMRRQKTFYKKYRTNGFRDEDKVKVDRIKNECSKAVTIAQENYLKSLGNKLIDKKTGHKTYWTIINRF